MKLLTSIFGSKERYYVLPWISVPTEHMPSDYRYQFSRMMLVPSKSKICVGTVWLLNDQGQCGPQDWQYNIWNWKERHLLKTNTIKKLQSWDGSDCYKEQAMDIVDQKLKKLGFNFVPERAMTFL